MIDLIQRRCSIGSFKLKVKCYIGKYTNNAFDIGVLHTVPNIFTDYAVLHITYSGKVWQGESLANWASRSFGEGRFGEYR